MNKTKIKHKQTKQIIFIHKLIKVNNERETKIKLNE